MKSGFSLGGCCSGCYLAGLARVSAVDRAGFAGMGQGRTREFFGKESLFSETVPTPPTPTPGARPPPVSYIPLGDPKGILDQSGWKRGLVMVMGMLMLSRWLGSVGRSSQKMHGFDPGGQQASSQTSQCSQKAASKRKE
jgi:hypothetical protein